MNNHDITNPNAPIMVARRRSKPFEGPRVKWKNKTKYITINQFVRTSNPIPKDTTIIRASVATLR
jgi:hypothetical protein